MTISVITNNKEKQNRKSDREYWGYSFLERWSGKSSLKRYPPGETLNEVREGATQISGVRACRTGEEHVQRPWGQSSVHGPARRLEPREQQGACWELLRTEETGGQICRAL